MNTVGGPFYSGQKVRILKLTREQLPGSTQVIEVVHMTWLFNVPFVGLKRVISADMSEKAKITKIGAAASG